MSGARFACPLPETFRVRTAWGFTAVPQALVKSARAITANTIRDLVFMILLLVGIFSSQNRRQVSQKVPQT
jgi:hypothetical protein